MKPERLIELARNAGMFVTTEMQWQFERWETLAKLISDEPACTWPKGREPGDELVENNMKWLDRFKPHKGDVYRPGQTLPEPGYETATGRKLYTVQQIRAAYAQGQKDSISLLRRARNLLSHPPGWVDTPSNAESRYALSVEIAEHMNGLELSEAWTEKQKREWRAELRRGL